ncbi:MAG: DUF3488 and transglutaminase-like domain-containing protein [Actinomycetota bacterium]|nr:DUF3488 and transglutaminase-like domain-containing protein [Actinomycetota bacterium]
MERRVGRLAGLLGFVLVIGRLGRLLLSGDDLPQWRLILVASAVLGAVVWWLLQQVSTSPWIRIGGFTVAGVILFLRVAVPKTLAAGIIPTAETLDALGAEMETAFRLIRSGVPPVVPTEGVLAILAIVVWVVGALFVWGQTGGPVAAMVVPSMVMYLQFSVFDRQEAGWTWMVLSAAMIGMSITALGLERKVDAGRARDVEGKPKPRRSVGFSLGMAGLVALAAIGVTNVASSAVSEYGNYPWRSGDGRFGDASGGGSYDPFVGLRQRLVNPTGAVLFRATLGENSPPASELFWRMEVLDEFDGTQWGPSSSRLDQYDSNRPVGDPDHDYQGTSTEVLQRVFVDGLTEDLVPTIGVVNEVFAYEDEGAIDPQAFTVTPGGALVYQPRLTSGDQYQVTGQYALHTVDIGALATGSDGELSPIFSAAAEAGKFTATPQAAPADFARPNDLDRFRELPRDTPAAIRGIAAFRTNGATTDYERATLLQAWFRESGDFEYSTNVTTGNSALVLEDWLTDTTSQNYRTGYCEQFATSMAVLGRALDIPSRVVWGFTPGSIEIQIDPETGKETKVVEVKDLNAHAWVEMWMDGFGWVQFDPTPRGGEYQPESITVAFDPTEFLPEDETGALDPLADIRPPIDPGAFVDLPPGFNTSSTGPRWWLLTLIAVALLVFVPPLTKRQRRQRRLKRLRQGDITAAWDELVDRLVDLGDGVPAELTPLEYANKTDLALISLAAGYSATVYGGYQNRGEESHMYAVDGFVDANFDGFDRAKAAINPRSLIKRN